MINIVTAGCSFTEDPDSWANILQSKLSNDYNVYNCSKGGVGQEYITRSTLLKLNELKDSKTMCIIQFSGFSRLEIIVSAFENPLFEKVVQERPEWDIHRSWYNGILKGDDTFVLKTTDAGHSWWKNKPTVEKMLDTVNQLYGMDQRLCRTYESILTLQMYCKQHNIPLLCFWGWADARPTWFAEMENTPINKDRFPLASHVYNLVDWDNFWFHNNYSGMAEWMIDNGHTGKLEEDHTNNPPKGYHEYEGRKLMIGHPTMSAHNDFCEQVIVPWVNSVLK